MRAVKTWLMVLVLLGTTAVVSTLDVVVPRAAACDCREFTFEEAVDEVDLIAEVTMVEDLGAVGTSNRYLLSMQQVWKGEPSQFIVVSEYNEETSCGLPQIPAIGAQWQIWGFQGKQEGYYSESDCLLVSLVDEEERNQLLDERFGPATLVTDADPVGPSPSPEPSEPPGEGDDESPSSGEESPWWQSIPLVIAAFAALAATAGGVVLAFGRKPHHTN